MSDDLVEKVARAICFSRNEPTCLCTQETGCLASVMVRAEATQARAAIAAVIEFLYLEAGRSVCPGAAAEYLSAKFLEEQINE